MRFIRLEWNVMPMIRLKIPPIDTLCVLLFKIVNLFKAGFIQRTARIGPCLRIAPISLESSFIRLP
jgi:hypothetical protein